MVVKNNISKTATEDIKVYGKCTNVFSHVTMTFFAEIKFPERDARSHLMHYRLLFTWTVYETWVYQVHARKPSNTIFLNFGVVTLLLLFSYETEKVRHISCLKQCISCFLGGSYTKFDNNLLTKIY